MDFLPTIIIERWELTFPGDNNLFGPEKVSDKLSDKPKMSDKMSDILSDIFVLASSNDFITTNAVVAKLSLDARTARRYITRLVDYGYLVAEGGNKNKKYRRAKKYGAM